MAYTNGKRDTAEALYASGWRSHELDDMIDFYGITEAEATEICDLLDEIATEEGKESAAIIEKHAKRAEAAIARARALMIKTDYNDPEGDAMHVKAIIGADRERFLIKDTGRFSRRAHNSLAEIACAKILVDWPTIADCETSDKYLRTLARMASGMEELADALEDFGLYWESNVPEDSE